MRAPRRRPGWAGRLLLIAALAGLGLRLQAPAGPGDDLRLQGVGHSAPAAAAKEKKPKVFAIEGAIAGLFPGASRDLVLTVTDPFRFDIEVTSLTVSVDGSDRPGCDATSLVVGSFSGSLLVPSGESRQQAVPVRLAPDAPDACQAATFELTFGGEATKA